MSGGRVYARKFDWDEARRLRRKGLAYREIGERLGVSSSAIEMACDPRLRAMRDNATAARQRSGICSRCGAKCSFSATDQRGRAVLCRKCANADLATSVRPTTLRCSTCREWKPDADFHFAGATREARRGRHDQCKACQVEARRAYRERNKVPCEDCGTLVEGKGRCNTGIRNGRRVQLDPNRSYLCRSCAMARHRSTAA